MDGGGEGEGKGGRGGMVKGGGGAGSAVAHVAALPRGESSACVLVITYLWRLRNRCRSCGLLVFIVMNYPGTTYWGYPVRTTEIWRNFNTWLYFLCAHADALAIMCWF